MSVELMANPYAPPKRLEGPDFLVSSAEMPPVTLLGRLGRALCFALGCSLGMHLGVAVDEGVPAAVQRSASDPLDAMAFFAVLSIICVVYTASWKWMRGRFVTGYVAVWDASLFAGVLLTGSTYVLMSNIERQLRALAVGGPPDTLVWWTAFLGCLALATFCAVELEAFWTRVRTRWP